MVKILNLIPGTLLAFAAVLVAKKIEILPFIPFTISGIHPIDAVLIIIILGIVVGNIFTHSFFVLKPGISFVGNKLLQLAVVLLGAKLNFYYVIKLPLSNILIIILSLIFAYILTLFITRKYTKIEREAGDLLAFAMAICGATAIAVVGSLTKAKKNNISLAVSVVALCGAIAMFVYPIIGKKLGLTDNEFGLLAGATVHSVPQAIGTGLIFSTEAGDQATITKLIRVLLLCPMIIIYLVSLRKKQIEDVHFIQNIFKYFPPFILGFFLMSIMSSLGLLVAYTEIFAKASSFLILAAMFAIGFNTNFKELIKSSHAAILVGLVVSFALLIFTYLLIKITNFS